MSLEPATLDPVPVICPIRHTDCLLDTVFASVIERVLIGVIIVDARKRSVLHANPTAKSLLFEPDHTDFSSLLDRLEVEEAELASSTPLLQRSVRWRSSLLGYSLYPLGGALHVIFVNDVTEKARLESIAQAANLMDHVGYVFAGIRHEIGNPLNSIKVALSVLRRDLDVLSGADRDAYFDRIMGEVDRLEQLLLSLRSYSLFETPDLRDVEVGPLLDTFMRLIGDGLELEGIAVEVACEPGLRARVDPRALQQVLLNLVKNAADAVTERDHPRISLIATNVEGRAVVQVQDNGVGIPADTLERLFEPFFTSKPKGTGLGLTIVRRMLVTMGADIRVEGYEGVGTVVSMILPGSSAAEHSPVEDRS